MANPPARERQTGFVIAKGWWKEAGRQLGAEEKQSPECQLKEEFAQKGACLLWKGCGNGHGARLLPPCRADGETEAAREGLCLPLHCFFHLSATKALGHCFKLKPFLCVSCHILLRKTTSRIPRHCNSHLCETTSKAGRDAAEKGMAAKSKTDRKASYPRAPAWSRAGKLQASCRGTQALPAALAKGW